jgi:hypothetical protein
MKDLNDALRQLKAADAGLTASPEIAARLRAEVRALARARTRRLQARVLQLAAVIALVAIPLAWWLSAWMAHARSDGSGPERASALGETTTAFFPLFYSSVPISGGRLVRMEVPQSAPARFGVIAAQTSGASPGMVIADVLVGDDGLARAVRFVHMVSREQ